MSYDMPDTQATVLGQSMARNSAQMQKQAYAGEALEATGPIEHAAIRIYAIRNHADELARRLEVLADRLFGNSPPLDNRKEGTVPGPSEAKVYALGYALDHLEQSMQQLESQLDRTANLS